MGNETSQTSLMRAWNINLSFLPGEICFSVASLSLVKHTAHRSYVNELNEKQTNAQISKTHANSPPSSPMGKKRGKEKARAKNLF